MTITFHDLPSGAITDPSSYQRQLYLELCQMECVGGVPTETIYDDGADAHNPTIGVGFNLRASASLLAVMQAYLGYPDFGTATSTTYQQDENLISNLTTVMSESWDGDSNVAARTQEVVNDINAYFVAITPEGETAPSIASFQLDGTQIQTAFTALSTGIFEKEVTTYKDVPLSDERIALMSLAWNSPTPPLHKGSLLGPGLLSALNTGDRAAAWFQIRYNSNGGSSVNNGIAKRRYFESQLFGLYNESNGDAIPIDEALQVYGMMSESTGDQTNRNLIFNYENEYSAEVADANNDYHNVLGITVQTLEAALLPAATTLWQHDVADSSLNPFAQVYANSNAVSSLDIQVASAQGGTTLRASQRNGYQLDTGSASDDKPSVLIAQGGDETLDGTGSANDALIGYSATDPNVEEPGTDTFIVGSGNDYIVAGTGSALIDGGTAGVAMGGGNDTVVLGDPTLAHSFGTDTVWAGRNDTLYVGAGDSAVIHLSPLGQTAIEVVSQDGDSVSPLNIDATALVGGTPGTYLDATDDVLVKETQNSDGTFNVELFGLGGASSSSQAMALQARPSASPQDVAPQSDAPSLSGGFLELDNFQGTSDAGVTLSSGNTTTPGASNLDDFGETTYSAFTEYQDFSGTGGADSMYGTNTTGGDYNILEGEGNAGYIYAGDGNNEAFADDIRNSPAWSQGDFSHPVSTVIQGGSGDQVLVGMAVQDGVGNGNETLIGGDVGQDTTAWTTIDGGGLNVDALLVGGTQNSLIVGGAGTDTIIAGSTAPASGQPAPQTIALAGLTFWAYSQQVAPGGGSEIVTSEPEVSIPVAATSADFQVSIALDQIDADAMSTLYGAPFGLLGSEWDTGTTISMWYDNGTPMSLPGSLLIGGNGDDYLIGNASNDTIIGGTPANVQANVVNEVLVGAGGANVIYGGDGNEWIYADLSPAADAGWADLDPADADTVYGGSGDEDIYGSGGNDIIYGGSGNYTIYTGNGNAYVEMGSGNSIVNGGTGNDTLIAGSGVDSIATGDGNDSVYSGDGQSTISIGAGTDTLIAGAGTTTYNAGTGDEIYQIGMGAGNQTILGSASASSIDVSYVDGVTSGDVVARCDTSDDLILTNEATGSQVEIAGYFDPQTNVSVSFSDGATWTTADILQASMTPDVGNDLLVGSNGDDTITGGPGEDTIVGVMGSNVLTGGTGDSTIYGGSGADTIEGGTGSNQLYGGTGAETYLFNIGDGSDTITENATAAGTDVLDFGTGITPSDVTFSEDSSDDLLFSFGNLSPSTIEVVGFMATVQSPHQIGTFQFTDGTSLTRDQIVAWFDPILGTTGNEDLTGTSGPDYFDGKGGHDYEIGNGGSDTFVFNSGYGNLEINETYAAGQVPVLQLGAGISESALQVTTLGTNSLYLTDGISGDQIELYNEEDSPNGSGVAEVQFADGSTLSAAQLLQMSHELVGTSGSETLWGTQGADRFDGNGGGDDEIGLGGNDTFVFDQGYGSLRVQENYLAGQQPALQLGPGLTASALRVTTDGTNLMVTDGIAGDEITLVGMWSTADAGVAMVQFADDTTLTVAQLIQMEMTGTTGKDTIYGTPDANLIDGKGGNDYEIGDGGNDTFVYNSGYGDLAITETYTSGQQPVLQLGPGLTASAMHVSSDGYSLTLTDGVAGDEITLGGMWSTPEDGVALVQFDDDTTLTAAQLIQMEMTGTTGSDTIYGTPEANLIDGKGGNDYETGDGGNDTFVYSSGYGNLAINNTYTTGQEPVLQLGPGLTASALHVTSNGTNLTLTDGVSGDQLTLYGMLSTPDRGVAMVQFADSTTLTAAQLIQMGMTGTTGNDTIYGTPGGDLIDGKGGNDYEVGDGGNDTFVYNAGYGDLAINNSFTTGQQPVLQLGPGLTASALRVISDGADLILTDGISGDEVTLYDMWWNPDDGAALVRFADSATLTRDQLIQMEMAGTAGNDTIYGTSGADFIDGEGGDDVEYGEDGSDTFVFNSGYGHLTIGKAPSQSGSSILELGTGISSTALAVTENEAGDLVLTDGVPGDQITLLSASGSDSPTTDIQTVQCADGSTFSQNQLIQMATDLNGTTGSDYLVGTTGADLIDGKGDDDIEFGNGGADTFVYNQGYGALEIGDESGYTLKLGPGIAVDPFESNSHDGMDLILEEVGGAAGDVIRLDGMLSGGDASANVVEFSDGSTISVAQLDSEVQYFFAGGNFPSYGGSGNQTYRLGANSVDESVYNAVYAEQIDVYYVDGITSADVTLRGDAAGNLYLTNKSTGSVFTLPGYFGGPIDGRTVAPLFIHFSDGTTWDAGQILQQYVTPDDGNDSLVGSNGSDTITGGPGNDTIVGIKGDNVLTGGTGNSTIYGGSGTDTIEGGTGTNALYGGTGLETYLFNVGDGSDTITENASAAGTDVLKFGSGIAASDVAFSLDGLNDLLITFGAASTSTVDVANFTATGDSLHQIGTMQLADGTTYTRSEILKMVSGPDLAGTAGNDLLVGSSGADLFDGQGGIDTAVGCGGNDTFIFNAGYGDLEINESYASGQQPILQLGVGITSSALRVSAYGNNLVVTDGVSGDQITLDNENKSNSVGVALVQFADGTTLSAGQLFKMAQEIDGTAGNDTLTGTSGADVIDGKGGNDSVVGNGGNDTFVFNSGYGDLEINESYASGDQPVLQLGAGITASALHVSTDQTNLFLTDGVVGDQIQLDNMWYGSGGVASVKLTDGTTFTASQLRQMEMTGTTGDDTIYGTSGADLIDGRGGPSDQVIGDYGNDTFVFNAGYGGLVIFEDYVGDEQPVLQFGAGITASMLRVSVNGDSLDLTDGIGSDWIELYDQGQSDGLDGFQGIASVQFADGTSLSAAQLVQMSHERIGTAGNDTLTGTAGAELFNGEGGTDSVVGDGGNDTIDFNSGYGQLTINESYTSGQQPELDLGAGITAAALHVAASGNNLVLTDGVSGDKVTLISMWSSATHGVSFVQLADGTKLTRDQLIQMEMAGTTGNDTLTGTSGADLLDGKGGTDSLIGSGGNDTFVFDSGYGALTINEKFTTGQQPVLQLGDGITTSMLRATKSGNNLVLTDGVSGDKITLYDMWSSSSYGVEEAKLADGTVLTRSQLIQMEMVGTTGNDTIYGTSGANLLDGKGGTDSLVGSGGNDTFVFNPGYGKLTINESFTSGQQPILQLGAGLTESALRVTSNGTNLFLADGVTGDKVTLISMWSSSTHGVSTVDLADGTSLTRAQLLQMEMTGITGNDTIYGTSGADLIDGKGGTDSLVGSGGNDTFVFDSGYGQLTINESYTSGQQPVLKLGSGITSASLSVATSGTGGVNLVLTDGITGDKITLIKMATSSTNGVATVQLSDGTTLTRSQLLGMEQASAMEMATPSDATNTGTAGGVALAGSPEASRNDTSIPTALHASDSTSGNLVSPSQVTVGAGSVHLPSTAPNLIPSAGAHVGGPQESHGISRAGTHTGQSTAPDARLSSQPSVEAGRQQESASNSADQQQSALQPVSALNTRLGSNPSLTPVQNESEATPRPGAPADPLMNDPDDLGARSELPLAFGTADQDVPWSGAVGGWKTASAPGFAQRQAMRTADTVESMVKALAAQGGMGTSRSLLDLGTDSPNQIRLQGGTTWSISTVDQTLAAQSQTAGAASDPSSRLTDLAHAQLISAMASFSPTAQAESSSLLAPSSEAYAIAVAAPMQ